MIGQGIGKPTDFRRKKLILNEILLKNTCNANKMVSQKLSCCWHGRACRTSQMFAVDVRYLSYTAL